MNTMYLGFIILGSIYLIGIIFMIILFFTLSKIYDERKRKNDIEELKTKNDLYRVYMDIDLVKTEEIIDNILKAYINKWVLVNIDAKGGDYIKDAEVQELIKYVTANFIAEMSDVHLFYIKCLTTLTDDESLIRYIRNKVKLLVLDFITDYNSL